jgi:hypothetical protein
LRTGITNCSRLLSRRTLGFVDTFRKQFGEHLYTALSGAAQKAASDAEHPGWIGGIVDSVLHKLGASDETKQENVEQLKLAADEFRKSATGYGQQIGVQEGAKESKLAQFAEPISEMVSLSRLGLPAFMAEHRAQAYGEAYNATKDEAKSQRAANIATAGDFLVCRSRSRSRGGSEQQS